MTSPKPLDYLGLIDKSQSPKGFQNKTGQSSIIAPLSFDKSQPPTHNPILSLPKKL